jgi:hypothetical protein
MVPGTHKHKDGENNVEGQEHFVRPSAHVKMASHKHGEDGYGGNSAPDSILLYKLRFVFAHVSV